MTYYNTAEDIYRDAARWLRLHEGGTDPRVVLAMPLVREIEALADGIRELDGPGSICGLDGSDWHEGELCPYLDDANSAYCDVCDDLYATDMAEIREKLADLRTVSDTAVQLCGILTLSQYLYRQQLPNPTEYKYATCAEALPLWPYRLADRIDMTAPPSLFVDPCEDGIALLARCLPIQYPTVTAHEDWDSDDPTYLTTSLATARGTLRILCAEGGSDLPQLSAVLASGDAATEEDIRAAVESIDVMTLERPLREEADRELAKWRAEYLRENAKRAAYLRAQAESLEPMAAELLKEAERLEALTSPI